MSAGTRSYLAGALAFIVVLCAAWTLCPVFIGEPVDKFPRRHPGFPTTYIDHVEVSVTSPDHWVHISWSGPEAKSCETGPFRSSPGAGRGNNDCNCLVESNAPGSYCTPKGVFTVEQILDALPSHSRAKHAVMIDGSRGIALHASPDLPLASYPSSHGCIRLQEDVAQLIQNNVLPGITQVTIDGKWSAGPVLYPPQAAEVNSSEIAASEHGTAAQSVPPPSSSSWNASRFRDLIRKNRLSQ